MHGRAVRFDLVADRPYRGHVPARRVVQGPLFNTLMLQDVLAEPAWAYRLTPADRRGLTPLFWSHVRPYGEANLDLGSRLDIGAIVPETG